MNREQAKQLLPIIQAFADGAELQFRERGRVEWSDSLIEEDDWLFTPRNEYRIKPKPVEGWGTIQHDGDLSTLKFHVSEAEARQLVIRSEGDRRMFRWVEVI